MVKNRAENATFRIHNRGKNLASYAVGNAVGPSYVPPKEFHR